MEHPYFLSLILLNALTGLLLIILAFVVLRKL